MQRIRLICASFILGLGLPGSLAAAEIDVKCTEKSIIRQAQAALRAIVEGRGTQEDARALKKIEKCYRP